MKESTQLFSSANDFRREGQMIIRDSLSELRRDSRMCEVFNQALFFLRQAVMDSEIIEVASDVFGPEIVESILLEGLQEAMHWHSDIGGCSGKTFAKRHGRHIQKFKEHLP